jgi:hypothetical protein
VLCCAVLCCAVLCCAVLCCAVLRSAVLCWCCAGAVLVLCWCCAGAVLCWCCGVGRLLLVGIHLCRCTPAKNAIFEEFTYKNDHFAKTGSGQT